mmetsp:Transcript_76058/g.154456  ORF Transcript_76058/g.154456 Transcript_76058/m.154456 type:complete len:154 (+) Transcript_76058:76-537(+)
MTSPSENADENVATRTNDGSEVATVAENDPQQEHNTENNPEPQVVVADHYTTNVEPNNPLPLDWTKLGAGDDDDNGTKIPPRCPHEVAEWSPEDTEICIVGTAGQKNHHAGGRFFRYQTHELIGAHYVGLAISSHQRHDGASFVAKTGNARTL